jgi:prepilin-type N-terminal cleavage/methylation domain-containing protein
MKTVLNAAGCRRSEDGFTLVETLIALMILAVAAGLFVQSVALATGQIKTSASAENAELLAVSLLAERTGSGSDDPSVEGMDQASGLHWRVVQERRARIIDGAKLAGATVVSIDIRTTKDSAPLYQLRSISMEDGRP